MTNKLNLLGYRYPHLVAYLSKWGGRPQHATALFKALHKEGITDIMACTFLSKTLRQHLQATTTVAAPTFAHEHHCDDGTIKWLVAFPDGNQVETVYIPEAKRATLCVSSQVGCLLSCRFCATGQQGYNRNLTAAEITGQLWQATQRLRVLERGTITNVVFMGMGEPLLNLDAVLAANDIFRDDRAYGLSKRRVTISTAGVVPAMYQFADQTDSALALSLHTVDDALRTRLMPSNRKYPLAAVWEACNHYLTQHPKNILTLEYTLLADQNDTPEQAQALARTILAQPHAQRFKVNLIPFNAHLGTPYQATSALACQHFQTILDGYGIITTIRKTRGDDIEAACGTLRGRVQDKTKRQARWRATLPIRKESV